MVRAARALGIEMKNVKVSPTTGRTVSTANLVDEAVTENTKSGMGMMKEQGASYGFLRL